MTRKEIKKLNNKVITLEELDEIVLNEEVKNVVDLGRSCSNFGAEWFSVEFTDGTDIDVFCFCNNAD